MGKRRKARELAMQALFSMDLGKNLEQEQFDLICQRLNPPNDIVDFYQKLVAGTMENRDYIDTVIEHFSNNWKLGRMACVDRNILRIATYEMLYCRDIPAKVAINEAIDIGKKFGTNESGGFINGILDSMRQALERGDLEAQFQKIQINEQF